MLEFLIEYKFLLILSHDLKSVKQALFKKDNIFIPIQRFWLGKQSEKFKLSGEQIKYLPVWTQFIKYFKLLFDCFLVNILVRQEWLIKIYYLTIIRK